MPPFLSFPSPEISVPLELPHCVQCLMCVKCSLGFIIVFRRFTGSLIWPVLLEESFLGPGSLLDPGILGWKRPSCLGVSAVTSFILTTLPHARQRQAIDLFVLIIPGLDFGQLAGECGQAASFFAVLSSRGVCFLFLLFRCAPFSSQAHFSP